MSNNQVEACLLMNRRIEQRQEHSITHTEITERRVIQEEPSEMQHYKSGIGSDLGSGGGAYHPHSNGHQPGVDHSPHSSHLSLHSDGKVSSSKVMHEVTHQHVGSDAQSLDYVAMPLSMYPATMHQCGQYVDYDHMEPQYHLHFRDYEQYPGGYATGGVPAGSYGTYGERAPGSPPSPSERSGGPSPQHDAPEYLPTCYDELADRFGATPSPGLATADPRYAEDARAVAYGYAPPAAYGVRAFDGLPPLDGAVRAPISASRAGTLGRGRPTPDDEPHGMRWRDPNLTEVIGFLDNPNNVIKANAAAYLQHLCYMDDPNKQKTRALGGIPPLVRLLSNDSSDVYRNACGALRNLSYGRQNDENKRAIKNAGGIPALIDLLRRTTEGDVKELVTGVVWNMSSCEDLKRAIIDDGVAVIVTHVVAPHSGWDPVRPGETHWSNVFRNASGVLRNVSSAGEYARKKLRECDGLVDALLYVVRSAIDKANIGNKIVENCVCVLRNLSYRCQEVEDPNYDRNPPPTQSRATENPSKGENLGCFGASKKKRDAHSVTDQKSASGSAGSGPGRNPGERRDTPRGAESLWQPDVVQSYLALLQSCSNPETLEAAAGALQNLSACYWQPSIEIRAAVRKEKGLPILVELLRMEVDRVVCAVATALRNLAIDQRNKELIGKYAMRDLVQKLPSGNTQHDQGTSDDTIAAVLATLNEVVKKNAEFSRSLLESGGVDRLMNVTRQRQKYTPRVLKFASQVLVTMWQHPELRDAYKKHGWKEPDFVAKTTASRDATGGPNSPNNANSTLNRPMASQGGTRYEDRTMKRANSAAASADGPGIPPPDGTALYHRRTADDIVAVDASAVAYADGGAARGAPVVGGVRIYPPGVIAQPPANDAEPLYARVDLEKKRNRHSNVEAAADRREAGGGGEAERPLEARDDSWV